MNFHFALLLILLSTSGLIGQEFQIEQSAPFENVLLAMQTDSAKLFMNSFSEGIIGSEDNMDTWAGRTSEGKEKFAQRFGIYEITDFSYGYDREESKLIIYFKGEEQFRMRIILESGVWKLDEK